MVRSYHPFAQCSTPLTHSHLVRAKSIANGSLVLYSGVPTRILGVIPARFASSRFRGKALAKLAGRPMIQHVYERACMSRYIRRVFVATDDERIADVVHGFGGDVRMTRSD